MKLKYKEYKEKEVNAKKVYINAKCSDLCICIIYDSDGNLLKETDGYVPSFMPDGGGDYVDLEIDVDTGQILNWRANKENLEDFINEKGDE